MSLIHIFFFFPQQIEIIGEEGKSNIFFVSFSYKEVLFSALFLCRLVFSRKTNRSLITVRSRMGGALNRFNRGSYNSYRDSLTTDDRLADQFKRLKEGEGKKKTSTQDLFIDPNCTVMANSKEDTIRYSMRKLQRKKLALVSQSSPRSHLKHSFYWKSCIRVVVCTQWYHVNSCFAH